MKTTADFLDELQRKLGVENAAPIAKIMPTIFAPNVSILPVTLNFLLFFTYL